MHRERILIFEAMMILFIEANDVCLTLLLSKPLHTLILALYQHRLKQECIVYFVMCLWLSMVLKAIWGFVISPPFKCTGC